MLQLLGGIALAVALVWGSYSAGKSGAYASGYKVGQEDGIAKCEKRSQTAHDNEMIRLQAEGDAKASAAREQATADILDKVRRQHETEARDRAAITKERDTLDASVRSLRNRLRVQQTASRADSDSNATVPGDTAAASGSVDGADEAGNLSRQGEFILDLARDAETEAGRYRSCYRWVRSLRD